MKTRLKVLLSLLIIVVVYGVYYLAIPAIINTCLDSKLINKLSNEIGVDLKLENPKVKMGYLPSLWLLCDDFSLLDKKNNDSPITIKKLKLKINLLPLFIGKLHINYFSTDSINVKMKFDKNSRFYLGDYLLMGNSNPKLSFENSKICVENYNFSIKDEVKQKNIYISGDYFKVLKFNSRKHLDLSVNSKITSGSNISNLNLDVSSKLPLKKNFSNSDLYLDGSITNLDLGSLKPYLKRLSNNKIIDIQGVVNFETKTKVINSSSNELLSKLLLNNFKYLAKGMELPIFYNGKLTISSLVELNKANLIIKDFQMKTKKSNLNIEGFARKINSNNGFIDIKITVPQARSEEIITLLPPLKASQSDIDLYSLKKYGFYSNVKGNLAIKGKIDKPNLYGEFIASDSYVQTPLPKGIPSATIKLLFKKRMMDLYVNVPTAMDQFVLVKGLFDIYDKSKTEMDITSSKKVNLAFAQKVLIPIHEVFKFDLGPVPIMKIAGNGNINLKVKGDNKDPHLLGKFNFYDATVSFNGVNLLLSKGIGTLFFNDITTKFVTNQAYLNNKPIKIIGDCSLKGVLSFKVSTNNQQLGHLIDALNTSEMLSDLGKYVKSFKNPEGKVDLFLELYGKVENVAQLEFGKSIFAKGALKLYGCKLLDTKTGLSLKNVFGKIGFDNTNLDLDILSMINRSKISLKGKIKDDYSDLIISSNNLMLSDIVMLANKLNSKQVPSSTSNSFITFKGGYKGNIDKIDIKNVYAEGGITKNNAQNFDLSLNSGNFKLKNGNLAFNKISGEIFSNKFISSGTIKNIGSSNQAVNLYLFANDFNLESLNELIKLPYLNLKNNNIISKISAPTGKLDLRIYIKNNVLSCKTKLSDISFVFLPYELPISILSGAAEIKNSKLYLYKMNSLVDSMPILVDGSISDFIKNPNFNLYINSKPTQKFIDKYINRNAIYPLKIKGDIIYSSRFSGMPKNFNAKAEINMQEDSSIYYMGSTLGDATNPIRIYLDTFVSDENILVKNFQYDKLISSQNNREFISQQLNAKGLIRRSKSSISLHNFKVRTQNPTDTKIFNIIFKKPLIKQGLFTSDLLINGPISSPLMKGDLSFTGIDIPLLDTTLKDISLRFDDDNIFANAAGEVFSNKITAYLKMKNNLNPPYSIDDIEIYVANLDVNTITKSLGKLQFESDKRGNSGSKNEVDLSSIIVKNAKLKADRVIVRNIIANNLLAKMSLNENMIFALDNFQFDIAEGKAKGNFKFNLLNSMTNLDMRIDYVNANLITEALFDLKNQIYGSLTGDVSLYCNGKSHKTCMDTLGGRGGFEVSDGRMPKLGSMEYLLKAGNLIKSGITGLTINGVIDVISPLKTGQFESIRGNFEISQGVADTIQIFTRGKDLSLFIDGKYNFSNLIADMNIYGRLSKKISTVLGPVGNASLNTLFNTIPGLHLDDPNNAEFFKSINKIPGFELNDKLYRIFTVEIYGDINGDNYVKSFKWVE